MHARGIPPTGNVTITDIEDYCANFEKKMGSFLKPREDLTDEDASKLGMYFLVMGRVWKKSGSGGFGYTRILKSLFRVCQVLEKLGGGEK